MGRAAPTARRLTAAEAVEGATVRIVMGGVLAGGVGHGLYPLRRFRFGSSTGRTLRAAAVGVGCRVGSCVPGGSASGCCIVLRLPVRGGGAPMSTAPAWGVCAGGVGVACGRGAAAGPDAGSGGTARRRAVADAAASRAPGPVLWVTLAARSVAWPIARGSL